MSADPPLRRRDGRADLPLRRDGRCAYCGGERKLPKARHRAEAALDPFCSTECCRAWHQVER